MNARPSNPTSAHASPTRVSRRRFARTAAAAAAAGYFASQTSAPLFSQSPNERLNLAAVGATGRAAANIRGVKSQNIVAIADIDANLLDKGASLYPDARRYRDFRVMLEKESEKLDGVVVSPPDHTHAPAAAMALRMKKPVYCEKPLTHTVLEARTLSELARKNRLATQMGNQIHSSFNYRRVVELVQSGLIGPVAECHVWANAVYTDAKFKPVEKPPHVDWDLWLGPAPERPYCAEIHPFKWRAYWDYGSGTLGDFGCHYMDLAHWALELTAPTRVAARGPKADPVSSPPWLIVDYQYPARGEKPPVALTWYDSGKRPEKQLQPVLNAILAGTSNKIDFRSGQLFVGEKGVVISDYGRHFVISNDGEVLLSHDNKIAKVDRPSPWIPDSIGHHEEWLLAIRTGSETGSDFAYAGPLTEAVLLGVVSHRTGEAFDWDTKKLTASSEKAQNALHKEYRSGWTL